MGQKVNPHGLRVGVIKDWDSKWYAESDFADFLVEDYNIRRFLKKKLYAAGVSKIEIERASDRVKVILYTAKPGVVIGKGGAEIEKVKAELQKFTDKKLVVDIKEVKRPDRDALSISILETPALYNLFFRYVLILWSSIRLSAKSASAYHLEFQSLITPTLRP